jgi:hypothetical protein
VPYVEISNGELLDRVSILRIKLDQITEDWQRENIQRELTPLDEQAAPLFASAKVVTEYQALDAANRLMWASMQSVYDWEGPFSPEISEAVVRVVKVNKDRAFAKARIDEVTNSKLREAKSFFVAE